MIDCSCEVVKDLIPLYVDKALSSESESLVKSHLRGCFRCRRYLKGCRTTTKAKDGIVVGEEHYEAFSKKLRARRNFRTGVTMVAFALATVNLAGFIFKIVKLLSKNADKAE